MARLLLVLVCLLCACARNGVGGSQLMRPPFAGSVVSGSALRSVHDVVVALPLGAPDIGIEARAALQKSLVQDFQAEAGIDFDKLLAGAESRRGDLLQAAKRLGKHYVLIADISRFSERVGSNLGAVRPAEVAFALELVAVANGVAVWSGSFSVRERSLSENFLRVERTVREGAKWKSAYELLHEGSALAAVDFASRRRTQFVQ